MIDEHHQAETQKDEIQAEITRRLAEIRRDPERLMRYDRNGDGQIDADEWAEVRRVVEAEVRTEIARQREDKPTHQALAEQARAAGDGAPREVLNERFEIVREAGRGSQGRAFVGRDRESGSLVLVKELAMDQVAVWKAVDLFEREATVLRGISHPAIPAFIDSFRVEKNDGSGMRFFLVQEFIDGADLEDLLNNGLAIDESDARAFLREMLGILDYLHNLDNPVIHRDIKPANIIKRSDRRLALVDFGAVQMSDASASNTTIIGTSGYMPLEQLMGRAEPATDIYALGATLVHLLSRKHPADLPVVEMALQFQAFINVSPLFENLLERMLAVHVEDRFQSAREVLEFLDAAGAESRRREGRPGRKIAKQIQFEQPNEQSFLFAKWPETMREVGGRFNEVFAKNRRPSDETPPHIALREALNGRDFLIVEQPKNVPEPDAMHMHAKWSPEVDGFKLMIPKQWDPRLTPAVEMMGAILLVLSIMLVVGLESMGTIIIVMGALLWLGVVALLMSLCMDWFTATHLTLKDDFLTVVEKRLTKSLVTHYEGKASGLRAVCKKKLEETGVSGPKSSWEVICYIDILGLGMTTDIAPACEEAELLYLCQEMNQYFLPKHQR